MRALLVILPNHVVREERLAAARGPEDELVTVGDDAFFHRQIGDVEMDRAAGEAIGHFDTEGGERVAVVRFGGEEAERRVDEGVERFFGREVGGVAGDARPIECRRVDRVVPRTALHKRESTADVVLDLAQLLRVVAPRQHVEVRTDRGQPLRPREVEVLLNPRLIDLIAPGIAR